MGLGGGSIFLCRGEWGFAGAFLGWDAICAGCGSRSRFTGHCCASRYQTKTGHTQLRALGGEDSRESLRCSVDSIIF
jgi:hypothetical protein